MVRTQKLAVVDDQGRSQLTQAGLLTRHTTSFSIFTTHHTFIRHHDTNSRDKGEKGEKDESTKRKKTNP